MVSDNILFRRSYFKRSHDFFADVLLAEHRSYVAESCGRDFSDRLQQIDGFLLKQVVEVEFLLFCDLVLQWPCMIQYELLKLDVPFFGPLIVGTCLWRNLCFCFVLYVMLRTLVIACNNSIMSGPNWSLPNWARSEKVRLLTVVVLWSQLLPLCFALPPVTMSYWLLAELADVLARWWQVVSLFPALSFWLHSTESAHSFSVWLRIVPFARKFCAFTNWRITSLEKNSLSYVCFPCSRPCLKSIESVELLCFCGLFSTSPVFNWNKLCWPNFFVYVVECDVYVKTV